MRKAEWSNSNYAGGKPTESLQQTLFNVRFGLKDEKIIEPKDKTVYAGTDTRAIYRDGWEVSNYLPHPREHHRKTQEDTKVMMQKTKIKNEVMVKDRYKAPYFLTSEFNERLRKEKEDLTDLKDHFMKETLYEMPKAAKERVEAVVFKKLYEAQHKA